MSGKCYFLGSVFSQQKFEVMDTKALSVSQLLDGLCVTWLGLLFLLPEVLTPVLPPSSDHPLFYFPGLVPSLSLSCCRLRFPILPT